MPETQTRYMLNKTEPLLREAQSHEQLLLSLTRIVKNSPPQKPWADGFKSKPLGFWTGPTCIAYLFLWVAKTRPEIDIEGHTPAEWCLKYLDCGSEELTGPKDLNGWGVKNEFFAYNTVKAAATQDLSYVTKLTDAITNVFECPDSENEYLSGRAGTLALLRVVKYFVPSAGAQVTACVRPLVEHVLSSVPWSFGGHRYIGAAHGDIGILTQVILSDPEFARGNAIVEAQLSELLDQQTPSGHWMILAHSTRGGDDVVEFCHGSPGFIISLIAIRGFINNPEIRARADKAIELGRQEVWEKGLLRKQPNLCHGITGNMLALEKLEQKEHFMAHATAEKMDEGIVNGDFVKGVDQYGLQWGEAGRAWGWLIMDTGMDLQWPGYTDV